MINHFTSIKALLFVLALAVSMSVRAETIGPRKITAIGCHLDWQVCYVALSGDHFESDGCKTDNQNQIRWDARNSVNGQNYLALLTAAYIAKKNVQFELAKDCFALQPQFPTFNWIWVSD